MSKVKFPKDIEFTGNRYGLTFAKGVAEVEGNPFILNHLKSKGFEIVDEGNGSGGEIKVNGNTKIDVLKTVADDLGITYEDDIKKKDLLDMIKSFNPDEANGSGGDE